MMRVFVRGAALGVLLAIVATLPATAQVIKKGTDYWRTPGNGITFFEFPEGDVEFLCGAKIDNAWDHRTSLAGVPTPGSDWDTAVARLDDAVFDTTGEARTRIQVRGLSFVSTSPHLTPCGRIIWRVGICCPQPITWMKLHLTSPSGGSFSANIVVNVEFKATDDAGHYLGSLFYTRELPDPDNGTPWSFGPGGGFRPGMTPADDCIAVLRQKLSTFAPTSSHYYFISDLIAQGKCREQTAAAK
jgi:hypothetical protein